MNTYYMPDTQPDPGEMNGENSHKVLKLKVNLEIT